MTDDGKHGLFSDPSPGHVEYLYGIVYDSHPPVDEELDADHLVDPASSPDDELEYCRTCEGAIAERQGGWHHVHASAVVVDLRSGSASGSVNGAPFTVTVDMGHPCRDCGRFYDAHRADTGPDICKGWR